MGLFDEFLDGINKLDAAVLDQQEPTSEARNFARIMWNQYLALVKQGFTSEQALTVIHSILVAGAVRSDGEA